MHDEFSGRIRRMRGIPPRVAPVHEYPLLTAADSMGGPAVVAIPTGAFSAAGYTFSANGGLSLTNALAAGDHYTVAFALALDQSVTNNYQRLLDFKNSLVDTGLYLSTFQQVDIYPTSEVEQLGPSGFLVSNVAYLYVITRDSVSKQVYVYVNGVLHVSYVDAADDLVFSTAGQKLIFAHDDIGDFMAGVLSYIATWDRPLTPAEVSAI